MPRLLTTTLLFVLTASVVSGQGQTVDLATRARGAAHIVIGTVVDVNPRFGTNASGDQLIYSDLVVEVAETLKGSPDNFVTVTVEGGTIGELTLTVSDAPAMRRGERAMYFLDRGARGAWIPHRRGLGILRVDAGEHVDNSQLTLATARAEIRRALR
jgi:hypothetical protein